MDNLYYQSPTDKIFEEVKGKAIYIWRTYDNTYGYVDEKVNMIKNLKNEDGSLMLIVSMFDYNNQKKLAFLISTEARMTIAERIKAGGMPDEYNVFL
jgi:hypothetical protein